jgi:hypothetical protein
LVRREASQGSIRLGDERMRFTHEGLCSSGLSVATTDADSSVLEPAARQMRARSRRYELDEVRAIFVSPPSTSLTRT